MKQYILVIIFFVIIEAATTSSALLQKRGPEIEQILYDCGSDVFKQSFIQEIVDEEKSSGDRYYEPYIGILYSRNQKYKSIPIPSYKIPVFRYDQYHRRRSIYHIILNEADQIVDVVAELLNSHHIKCKQMNPSVPELQDIDPNQRFGYDCGTEIFSHETVEISVREAKLNIGKAVNHPVPYPRDNYGKRRELLMFPILRRYVENHSARTSEPINFVVFSPTNGFRDVVAKLSNTDFAKCSKVTDVPSFPVSLSMPIGFQCGKRYFSNQFLERIAIQAKKMHSIFRPNSYPRVYNGPPFHENHFIYPLLPGKGVYGKGYRTKYFLVTDLSFKVIAAAIQNSQGMQLCQESMAPAPAIEPGAVETDDFHCVEVIFPNDQLVETVRKVCEVMGSKLGKFPAKYKGPAFNIPGPYFTWPILLSGTFKKRPGKFRVVFNGDCKLSGALINQEGTWNKCKRKSDNSIPGGESATPISEAHPQLNRYPQLPQYQGVQIAEMEQQVKQEQPIKMEQQVKQEQPIKMEQRNFGNS